MTAATEEAHRLLRIAKADYVACKALLAADGVRFAIAAFSAQQAIEKAMKVVLTLHAADFGRTHNLLSLHGQLRDIGLATPVCDDQLALLNPYAVVFRYDDIEEELIDATTLVAMVETVLTWAQARVEHADHGA